MRVHLLILSGIRISPLVKDGGLSVPFRPSIILKSYDDDIEQLKILCSGRRKVINKRQQAMRKA